MPIGASNARGIAEDALTGAATGSMFGPVGAGVGGILSVLSGIFGAQASPHDTGTQELLAKLEREMQGLKAPSFTQGQVEGKVGEMKQTVRGAANVAATATGTALSESLGASGTPQGQPKGDIYTAALAPTIAQGERDAASVNSGVCNFGHR